VSVELRISELRVVPSIWNLDSSHDRESYTKVGSQRFPCNWESDMEVGLMSVFDQRSSRQ